MLVFATPALLLKFDHANLTSLIVGDKHITDLFDVYLTEYKVLDMRVGPGNGEMLTCFLQFDML